MKLGVIGDCHFKEKLSYTEYIPDGRKAEFQAVLDTTVEFFKDCDRVVFLGDCFDVKNPPAKVIRAFTEFLERFNGKQIFIISGNHDKNAAGEAAIDYLREIKNPNWHIITNTIEAIDRMIFCPYFFRQELGVAFHAEATVLLLEKIPAGKYLFVHHAVSDTLTNGNQSTNIFDEIVLPKTELEKHFDLIIGGHIHRPGIYGKTLIAGSLFTSEAGDRNNAVWKIDTETNKIEKQMLPVRYIFRFENIKAEPLAKALLGFKHSIVKVVLTDKTFKDSVEALKLAGKDFDAFILQEQYPREREKKSSSEENLLESSIESLIKHYALQKKIDHAPLLAAWEGLK